MNTLNTSVLAFVLIIRFVSIRYLVTANRTDVVIRPDGLFRVFVKLLKCIGPYAVTLCKSKLQIPL